MGARSVDGFAGGETFDDAEREPIVGFDVEAEGLDVADRAAAEVFAAHRDGDQFEEALAGTHGPARGLDVVGEQQQPAGA